MNTKLFVLPSLCLGGAALLLAPSRPSQAFSTIGGSLSDSQRDVRVYDNFADATANNNITPASQFQGYLGVEVAVWKGIVEWGSGLHGDGTGDPVSGNTLGSGGANFDAMWAGNAAGIGTSDTNIISALSSCGGGGTLAYTETPISNGWRIRFCDEWTWDDGPGTISNRWDIQGVTAHEYGHALGLGHSAVGSATMAPSGSPGQTSLRSIAPDDIDGVRFIYGVASVAKPTITATVADSGAGTITVYGTNFSTTGNEVWFTNGTVSTTTGDPIVRVAGVFSSAGGTQVTVAIPANAGPGDVIVRNSTGGNSGLSNAFPTDLVGTFGNPPDIHPNISLVTPSTIDALIPGTAQTITLTGTNFLATTDVLLDGASIDPARYTIVDDTTITLDMPQASSLGAHDLGVTDGGTPDEYGVTIVAPATPKYELGNGDALNVVDRDNGLPFIVSGDVGSTHYVYGSVSNLPSVNGFVSLAIGNGFTQLISGGSYVIPAAGWLQITVPTGSLPDPGPGGLTLYAQTFRFGPHPFPTSNLQSIFLTQ